MWVCRAGKNAVYLDYFIRQKRIFLAWTGFKINLSKINDKKEYRNLVSKEMGTSNTTSISNWTGQILAFVKEMQVGDKVLIPYKGSRSFALVSIRGSYEFNEKDEVSLYHSRKVEVDAISIPADIFPQNIKYDLRAYRTIYKVKNEDYILDLINKWKKENSN